MFGVAFAMRSVRWSTVKNVLNTQYDLLVCATPEWEKGNRKSREIATEG